MMCNIMDMLLYTRVNQNQTNEATPMRMIVLMALFAGSPNSYNSCGEVYSPMGNGPSKYRLHARPAFWGLLLP